jgi:hypothetical protein
VCHGIRIITHIAGERDDWIAGAFPNALDIRFGVSIEDGAVFGKGKFLRSVFRWLPIGVIRPALNVIDCLTGQVKRHSQLDERLDFSLPRDDVGRGRSD